MSKKMEVTGRWMPKSAFELEDEALLCDMMQQDKCSNCRWKPAPGGACVFPNCFKSTLAYKPAQNKGVYWPEKNKKKSKNPEHQRRAAEYLRRTRELYHKMFSRNIHDFDEAFVEEMDQELQALRVEVDAFVQEVEEEDDGADPEIE